jgi:hypothetical protein
VNQEQTIMNEPIDIITNVEDAITDLQAMIDARRPDPRLVSEIERLDDRLQQIEQSQPVFSRPA